MSVLKSLEYHAIYLLWLHRIPVILSYNPHLSLQLYLQGTNQYSDGMKEAENEPRCEKTGLQGFQPGPTQIRLYSR